MIYFLASQSKLVVKFRIALAILLVSWMSSCTGLVFESSKAPATESTTSDSDSATIPDSSTSDSETLDEVENEITTPIEIETNATTTVAINNPDSGPTESNNKNPVELITEIPESTNTIIPEKPVADFETLPVPFEPSQDEVKSDSNSSSTPPTSSPTTSITLGATKIDIVVSATAAVGTIEKANLLASYLNKITGSTFEIKTGDGKEGIAFGLISDFSSWSDEITFSTTGVHDRETYIQKPHANGMILLGTTDNALENALWGFLTDLGYRQYFPGTEWEYIPHLDIIKISKTKIKSPAFLQRSFAFGQNFLVPDMDVLYNDWKRKNLRSPSVNVSVSHRYSSIKAAYPDAFAAHPEYSPQNGTGTGLCTYESGVQNLATDFAKMDFENNPTLDGASMSPNDGGTVATWSGCPSDPGTSTTDKALHLANTVARNLTQSSEYKDKLIGMYAYNDTTLPPVTESVDPNVRIFAATAFIKGELNIDEIIKGWVARGAKNMGIRDYTCVFDWSQELPGQNSAIFLDDVHAKASRYKGEYGMSYFVSEVCGGFGSIGPGLYLWSRMLLDADSKDAPLSGTEVFEEFLRNMFPGVEEPMREFYENLGVTGKKILVSDHLLGTLYSKLDEALHQTSDELIRKRILNLALYVRYSEMYRDFKMDATNTQLTLEQKTLQLDALVEYVYRIRTTFMVAFRTFIDSLNTVDPTTDDSIFESLKIYRNNSFNTVYSVTKANPPLYTRALYSEDEILKFISDGLANNPILEWEPVIYSEDLMPAAGELVLNNVTASKMGTYTRYDQELIFYATPEQLSFPLKLTSGYISSKLSLGAVEISVYPASNESVIYQTKNAVDKVTREFTITVPAPGLYRLVLTNNEAGSAIVMPSTLAFGKYVDDRVIRMGWHPNFDAAFYVPKGTTVIGGFAGGANVQLQDANGVKVSGILPDNYFTIDVPAGMDGKLWRFKDCTECRLYTVPPIVFLDDQNALLPIEVIEAEVKQ